MNNLLFFMAASGTIPLLVYLLLRYVLHLHIRSPGQLYTLLKVSLFFYLVPLPMRANEIKGYVQDIFHNKNLFIQDQPTGSAIELDMSKCIQVLPDGDIILPQYSAIFLAFLGISVLAVIILIIRFYRQYRRLRKQFIINSVHAPALYQDILNQVKKEIHLHRAVEIRMMYGKFSPLTFGIIHPVIVLPEDESWQAIYLSLLHECIHIQKLDFLFNLLGLAAIVVHWYLPFTYLLLHELKSMAEFDCDRKVSCFISKPQLDAYAELIFSAGAVTNPPIEQSPFISSFGDSSYSFRKERLKLLKNKNKKKLLILFAATLAASLTSVVSVAAYQVPMVYEMDSAVDKITFSTKPYSSLDSITPREIKYFSQGNAYFVADSGAITLLNGRTEIQPLACKHSYVTGTLNIHTPNSSGGCTVKVFSAKRCSKCGYIASKTLIETRSYVTCPH